MKQQENTYHTLTELQNRKNEIKKQISEQENKISGQYNMLVYTLSPQNLVNSLVKGVNLGYSIFDKAVMAFEAFKLFRRLFSRKFKRKEKVSDN